MVNKHDVNYPLSSSGLTSSIHALVSFLHAPQGFGSLYNIFNFFHFCNRRLCSFSNVQAEVRRTKEQGEVGEVSTPKGLQRLCYL